MRNPLLDALFVKTAVFCALVAGTTALLGYGEWSAAYSAAALFGGLNWWALSRVLLAVTGGKKLMVIFWLFQKMILLGVFLFGYVVQVDLEPSSFLAGFLSFLLVAFLESMSQLGRSPLSLRARLEAKMARMRADLIGRS